MREEKKGFRVYLVQYTYQVLLYVAIVVDVCTTYVVRRRPGVDFRRAIFQLCSKRSKKRRCSLPVAVDNDGREQ
jgi:hypothetical protein